MTNLINKLTKLAIIPILAGSLNGCENQKIVKSEGEDYVKFHDINGYVYEDLEKDGKLDIVYNTENYPNVRVIEILDERVNDDPAIWSSFERVYRKDPWAVIWQENFEEVKQNYEKQERK